MADPLIHEIPTTATSFASDDYIVLDGVAKGTRNMTQANLKNSVIAGNIAPLFDPTKTSSDAYAIGDDVIYDGKWYSFTASHYGAWNASHVTRNGSYSDYVKHLASASSLASTDVITVTNPTDGTRKMSKDDLMTEAAQTTLADNVAPVFDPTRTVNNPYLIMSEVIYNGVWYRFTSNHYGAWNDSHVEKVGSLYDYVNKVNAALLNIAGTPVIGRPFFANKNLFSYEDTVKGAVGSSNGYIAWVNDSYYFNLVPVSPDADYVISNWNPGNAWDKSLAIFNGNFVVIDYRSQTHTSANVTIDAENWSDAGDVHIHTPSRAAYVAFNSVTPNYNQNFSVHIQFEQGGTSTSYVEARSKLPFIKKILYKPVNAALLNLAGNPVIGRPFFANKNLFSYEDTVKGAVDSSNGYIAWVNDSYYFNLVPVSPDADYVISNWNPGNAWDKSLTIFNGDFVKIDFRSQSHISTNVTIDAENWSDAGDVHIHTPSSAAYIAFNSVTPGYNQNFSVQLQFEQGSTSTSYVEARSKLPFIEKKVIHTNEPLYGKRVLCIGDSITQINVWTRYLPTLCGCTVLNAGVSGSCITEGVDGHNSFVERFDAGLGPVPYQYPSTDDVDIIIVMGGINDWGLGTGGNIFGDINAPIDKTTFCGALRYLLAGLKTRYSGKPIFFASVLHSNSPSAFANWNEFSSFIDSAESQTLTLKDKNGKTLHDFYEAEKDVCKMYGVPFIDMFSCGISPILNNDRLNYFNYNQQGEGLHPNNAGGRIMAQYIISQIISNYNG